MAPVLLLLFIVVPIVEITLFIQVGDAIGLWQTIGLVILTAIAGTVLLRVQGLQTLRRAQGALSQGQAPVREVFDGACLLVAGVLLLTPGFMTDAFGLALFLPPVRELILRGLSQAVNRGHVQMYTARGGHPTSDEPIDLEGEYRDITPSPSSPPSSTAGSSGDRRVDPPRGDRS
jgi:UPF0716 protein FxsA